MKPNFSVRPDRFPRMEATYLARLRGSGGSALQAMTSLWRRSGVVETLFARKGRRSRSILFAAGASAGMLALTALNFYLGWRAERRHPAKGRFLDIGGKRLHYLDIGKGPVVLLLHGNGSMVEDFVCSRLIDSLSAHNRVIVFDRPGFGHSDARPDSTPEAQAALFAEALVRLGVKEAQVYGHSWGTLVAISLATSSKVRITGLVLAGGYYFPVPRLDVLAGSLGAIPVLGPLLCRTVLPLIARANWAVMVRNLFAPGSASSFSFFPRELALRPSQLHAGAKETALLNPGTKGLVAKCHRLAIPVILMAGAGDRVVEPAQSEKFRRALGRGELEVVPLQGHMLHHTARERVVAALGRQQAEINAMHGRTAV